ncbi:MAG: EpsG family protein [Nostocales cyanobacterium ELA583]|jgi:hypothetical protein
MADLLGIFPTLYFIIILFICFLINIIKFNKIQILWLLFFLYFGWSLFLGFRNIYDDPNLDPNVFYQQAKNLSLGELWSINFPKIDILLQLIMKFYFIITGNETLLLILTESTIISLIFIAVSFLTSFSPNSLLITISFMVFTNTGILMTANFLRQGLAIAIFLNIISISQFLFGNAKSIKSNLYNRFHVIYFVIFQFFAHMSSLYLLMCLFFVNIFQIRKLSKTSSWLLLLLFLSIIFIFGQPFFNTSQEVYSGYDIVNDEGVEKLTYKMIIDAFLIIVILLLKKTFFQYHNIIFNLLIKICFILFCSCLLYSYSPIIALRLEYYLNFLIIIALASLFSNKDIGRKIVNITMFLAISLMYFYSFFVYNHPSITRVLVF